EGKIFEPTGPCDFHKIDKLDAEMASRTLQNVKIHLLADVENTLLGSQGAISVFGPQKGIRHDELALFEQSMSHWVGLLESCSGKNIRDRQCSGASGGVPAGLSAFFNTEIKKGGEEILSIAGFHQALQNADIVITTEGQIDSQTGFGKGPGIVARYARDAGKKVIGICGQISDDYNPSISYFDAVFPINSKLYPLKTAISRTRPNLRFTAMQIANLLAS
ncbi:MAG: glycerate kinase, partial [Cyclobacteriaceae bacterium]|nr:glycerate kinase [Cyclobacteriaceae bacterium]